MPPCYTGINMFMCILLVHIIETIATERAICEFHGEIMVLGDAITQYLYTTQI